MNKPFSESCEQNRQPILEVLKIEFADRRHVLEIGSGTGQHAVYFGEMLPHLTWQPSDLPENHPGIRAWITDATLPNVRNPLSLDVRVREQWPDMSFDAVFSANAVHIMGWDAVIAMFEGLGRVIEANAKLALYGPFNYGGQFTSESNARFDQWLKARDPVSGIRNFEDLYVLAQAQGMQLFTDYEMPVNNRILVWRKVQ